MDPRVGDNGARFNMQPITPNGVIGADKPMLCPFHCGLQRVDLNGYCRHLIGWSVDGETVELREEFSPGKERVGHLLGVVEDGDVLVSGTPDRKNKAKQPCPTPSHRVYRKTGTAPIRDDGKQIYAKQQSVYDQTEADADTAAA